jgi:GNAT superfamily N-acetyltransferase
MNRSLEIVTYCEKVSSLIYQPFSTSDERSNLSARIRPLVESDLEFAMELANQEHWNYDLEDVKRLRSLFSGGCFVAEYNSVRAGWVVACTYGNLAWVSSLVVRDDMRGKGIGAALIDRLIRYSRSQGIGTVGLYSYQHSVGFYERMGFKQDCEYKHFEGFSQDASVQSVAQEAVDLGEISNLDQKYFHANREPLLRLLLEEHPRLLLNICDTYVVGYIAGRSFSDDLAQIGPWVCEPGHAIFSEQLFASEVSQLKSKKIELTIPSGNLDANRIVEKHGFEVKQRILRMFLGVSEDLPSNEGIYAAAGLDVG